MKATPDICARPEEPQTVRYVSSARLAQLLRRGSMAVTDQGLFAGANFLLSIMMARRLSAAEYGAYSLAYSAFLFLSALHKALFVEPMMIFGTGKYFEKLPGYLRLLIGLHVAVLGPACAAVWVITAVLGNVYSAETRAAFEGMAVSSIFMLLFWLARRVFYVVMKPALGVLSSCLYFGAIAIAAGMLWVTHTLSVWSAFLTMGAASLAVSATLLAKLVPIQAPEDAARPRLREVIRDHWRYGGWALASEIASWFPANIYYVLLAAWLGLGHAGGLRAVTNFVMPVLQAIVAVNMLMLPALVRDRRDGGARKMNQTIVLFFCLYCAGTLAYLSALWIFRGHLFQIAYGGRYSQYMGWPLLLACGLPLGNCAAAVLGNGLRAMERSDRMFWAMIVSAVGAAAVGIPLTAKFGVTGALAGYLCSSVVYVVALWCLYRPLGSAKGRSDADALYNSGAVAPEIEWTEQ